MDEKNGGRKIMMPPTKEEIAFIELKTEIVKLMYEFIEKYHTNGVISLFPSVSHVLIDVITACLGEAQFYLENYQPFTPKQIDYICYQIGEWYLSMKPLLEDRHNLGHMKEKLKLMICGD